MKHSRNSSLPLFQSFLCNNAFVINANSNIVYSFVANLDHNFILESILVAPTIKGHALKEMFKNNPTDCACHKEVNA